MQTPSIASPPFQEAPLIPSDAQPRQLRQQYERIRQGVSLGHDTGLGKILIRGPGALDVTNRIVMGDASRIPIKKMMSTFMLRETGSLLADVYVVNQGDGYLLLTEGADASHLLEVIKAAAGPGLGSVSIEDLTQARTILSLDGPYAWELLKDVIGMEILGTRYLEVVTGQTLAEVPLTIYRAGKTGEFGYWLDVPTHQADTVRARLLEAGERYELGRHGPEALAICKLENRFINIEREGTAAKDPLELNCRILISRDKGDYLGRAAIERALEERQARRLIGLTIETRDGVQEPPELGAEVRIEGTRVGTLANVAYSFTLGKPIAVALMDVECAFVGLDFEVESGGSLLDARTVSAPFILNKSLSIRVQEHSYFDQER